MSERIDSWTVRLADTELRDLAATIGTPLIVETEHGDVHTAFLNHDDARGYHVRLDCELFRDCGSVTVRRPRTTKESRP